MSWRPQPARGELRWPEGSHGASHPAELLRLPVGSPSPCHGLAHVRSGQGGGTGLWATWAVVPGSSPQSDQEESWKLLLKKETERSGRTCWSKPRIQAQLPTCLQAPAGWAAASPRSGLPPLPTPRGRDLFRGGQEGVSWYLALL